MFDYLPMFHHPFVAYRVHVTCSNKVLRDQEDEVGKEFQAQMVPEWQEAYMDYIQLKKILKGVIQRRHARAPSSSHHGLMKRKGSLYRAFSGLSKSYRANSQSKNHEDEVILINAVNEEDGMESYHTMFLRSSEEGGETELIFFKKLDHEFNKVLKFYRKEVEKLVSEADELSKQMNALIALRIKVHKPEVDVGSVEFQHSGLSSPPKPPRNLMGGLDEAPSTGAGRRFNDIELRSLDILERVNVNVAPATPRSTLKAFFHNTRANKEFSEDSLKRSEQLMRKALIEFHKKLRVLKSYCFMNQLAFSKIMKKYDKITRRSASKYYLHMVDNSYLGSSDELTKLVERVESTFIKHFAGGNHRVGMNMLRPKAKREKHIISFFIGLFFGWSIALTVAIVLLIHIRQILKSKGREQYMQNIFPLYAFFGFIVVHIMVFAADTYLWRRYQIYYQFIFGFKPGTELSYRELLLLSAGLAAFTLAAVISNLDMEMDPSTQNFREITELVPLALVLFVLLIMFCPFNIVHHSSRFFLIRCAFRCLCAPLYKVTFPDFFLADQLTSQVQAFRCLEFYICYYGWGDYRRRTSKCFQNEVFQAFYFIVAIIPYWCRFFQCIRRLFEEKDAHQGLNGLKYLSTIFAVAMRTSYDLKKGTTWKMLAAASSAVATVGNTYWDIFIDWGLMQRNSKNPCFRDKLLASNKTVYFVAMVVNVILRLVWTQSVLGFNFLPVLHKKVLTFVITCLEIFRRGMWNFFRLENEHLKNVGKFRAFKSLPLPFNYDDEDPMESTKIQRARYVNEASLTVHSA